MKRERREVWYTGHVQGVGFRYTAAALARRAEVTGYVRNLPDGRVHLVVEGESGAVAEFLASIAERMHGFIRDTRQDRRPDTGEFSDFTIRA
jgi:acylphosphatase